MGAERVGTVVVGGGQAGLAAGYWLARAGGDFTVLDAGGRVGDAWRARWDSLRLFTPACVDRLPGLPFPAPAGYLPTKDEMAGYLEAYAARFALPVRLGVRADGLVREDGRYLVTAGAVRLEADRVIVATGQNALPRIPPFAAELAPTTAQLHSSAYSNPGGLGGGAVLVVGAGNSGAEIALELAADRPVWLAGRDPGRVPVPLGCAAYRVLRRLTLDTRPGRWIAARRAEGGDPVVCVGPRELARVGVRRAPRVVGVRGGRPALADGRVLEVETVVWCTGYGRDDRWIGLPVFGADGHPRHRRGVVGGEPGLSFVGLRLQSSAVSELVGAVGDDAAYAVGGSGG